MPIYRRRLALLTSVATLGCFGSTAIAAESADSSTVTEVIVTAQKREQNLQDVPIAINAFGAQAIKDRGIETIADLATLTPGIKFAEFSSSANVAVRGVGTTIVSGTGESSVAVHIDGVYLMQPQAYTMVQEDLGSIEVLRGPQGTLYGKNAIGGVINFISARPTAEAHFGGTALYGNYGDTKGSAYISGPITDRIRGRIFVGAERRDGYTTNNLTGQSLEDLKGQGARVSLDADVADNWLAELRLTARHETYAGPVYDGFDTSFSVVPLPFYDPDPRGVRSTVNSESSKQLHLASLRNTWKIGELKLVSVTGYADFKQKGVFDGIGAALAVPLHRRQTDETWSQELNLSGNTGPLEWLVGAYGLHDKQSQFSLTTLSGLGLPDNRLFMDVVHESLSAFGDGVYSINDRFRLYGGARVLHESTRQDLTNSAITGGVAVDRCTPATVPQNMSDTAVTGRFGAQYDIAPRVMGYVQYSRGYKAGGFSQSTCNNPYKPENLDAGEAGIKSRFLDNRLTLNAAAFYYDYRNVQLEQASPAGIPVVNAPKAHVYGLDVDMIYVPAPGWRIGAALSAMHSQYDEFINSDPLLGVAPGVSLAGVRLNNAPELSATLSLERRFELATIGSLTLHGELYTTSAYNLREFDKPYTIQKGYQTLDFAAIYRTPDEKLHVRGFVKNATNETIRAGVLGFGGALGSFQAPRTYGVEIGADF
jgi:iron complex outermembrane receptor protein